MGWLQQDICQNAQRDSQHDPHSIKQVMQHVLEMPVKQGARADEARYGGRTPSPAPNSQTETAQSKQTEMPRKPENCRHTVLELLPCPQEVRRGNLARASP